MSSNQLGKKKKKIPLESWIKEITRSMMRRGLTRGRHLEKENKTITVIVYMSVN